MKQLIILMCLITSLAYVGCRKKCPELPPANKSNVKMETAIHYHLHFENDPKDSTIETLEITEPLITDSVMNYGTVIIYMQKNRTPDDPIDNTFWRALPTTVKQEYPPITSYPSQNITYTYTYSKGKVNIQLTPRLYMNVAQIFNFKIVTYRNI